MPTYPPPLRLPQPLVDVAGIASRRAMTDAKIPGNSGSIIKRSRTLRDAALIEGIVLNGLRICEVMALRQADVDLKGMRIRRNGQAPWLTLRTRQIEAWKSLVQPRQKRTPFFPPLSRVSIWRILRAAGEQAGLKIPLNSRRARRVLGFTLGRRHDLPARTLGAALGVHDPRSVARYLKPAKLGELPPSPKLRRRMPGQSESSD